MLNIKYAILSLIVLAFAATVEAQETRTYFVLDDLGSPVIGTDAAGNEIWSESYDPYGGKLTSSAAAADNNRWFTGAPHNSATGLIDLGYRQYDPIIGRFLGMDPAGTNTSDPFTMNRYVYANNNPFSFVDPDGRDAVRVRFVDQRIGIPGSNKYFYQPVSRGHSGSLIIRNDGLTKYREYGRYPGAGEVPGAVRAPKVMTDIAFADGVPTADSLSMVFSELLEIGAAAGSDVLRLTFDLDADDFDAMMSEAARWDAEVGYRVPDRTCHGFCEAISEVGGGDKWLGDSFTIDLTRDTLDQAVESTRARYKDSNKKK